MKLHLFRLFIGLLILSSCGEQETNPADEKTDTLQNGVEIYGNTQGTTYALLCNDNIELAKEEVDIVLANFDTALSSYISESVLSKLNNAPAGVFNYSDTFDYFNRCYLLSEHIFHETEGCFDPTVYPLVDGWGFMKNLENIPDSITVDSLLTLVGFNAGRQFNFYKTNDSTNSPLNQIQKINPNAKLDFNAIAQGLSVDVLCELLEKRGAKNYYVEIGGEIRVKGLNADGDLWRIGIDQPIENSTAENRTLQEIINLDNKAVATSGSYRKFYEKNGKKYSHTLNPKTGYPVEHNLLSATVVADNCATADALATAFMVMGPEKAIEFIQNQISFEIEAYLIFNNEKGRIEVFKTLGFAEMISSNGTYD